MKRAAVCVILLFALLTYGKAAGEAPFLVESFPAPEYLADNTASALFRDSRGLIWIGTYNGLNRYDGLRMVQVQLKRANAAASAPDMVNDICEDCNGNIWIGTSSGLFLYNPVKEEAVEQLFDQLHEVSSLHLTRDGKEILIPLGSAGVMRISSGGKATVESTLPVRCLSVGDDGTVWMVTPDGELWKTADMFRHLEPFFPPGRNPLSIYNIERLHCFGNKLLLGSRYHTAVVDIISGEVEPKEWLMVWDAVRKSDGNLLLATSTGLYLTDSNAGVLEHYTPSSLPGSRYNNNSTIAVCEDLSGGIWVGNYYNGVYHLAPNQYGLAIQYPVLDISVLRQDGPDVLLAGTYSQGLKRITKDGSAIEDILLPGGEKNIRSISLSKEFIYVVAGRSQNLFRINRKTLKAESLRGLSSSFVYSGNDGLWVRSGGYLSVIPDGTSMKKIALFSPLCAMEDDAGRLWFASLREGIVRVEGEKHKAYNVADRNSVSDRVHDLHKDAKGRIWACCDSYGLMQYNPHSDRFEAVPFFKSVPGTVYYSVISDERGNLWLKESDGLVAFNPDTGRMMKYSKHSGFPDWPDSGNSSNLLLSSDGRIYTGTKKGLLGFPPEKLIEGKSGSRLILAGIETLKTSGEALDLRNAVQGNVINLPSKAGNSVLRFADVDYSLPVNEILQYRTSGNDNAWITVDDGGIRLYNLSPGAINLEVRLLSGLDARVVETACWYLVIQPPTYLRLHMILLYVLLFALFVTATIYLARRQAIKKAVKISRARLIDEVGKAIRAPLSLIRLPAESLMENVSSHPGSQAMTDVQVILENLGKLTRMLNDLFRLNLEEFAVPTDKVLTNVPANMLEELHPGARRRSVLLFEPDTQMSHFIVRALKASYKVVAADSFETVSATLRTSPYPDIVICESGSDGVSLCGVIKNDIALSHIPVLMLATGTLRPGGLADSYLEKPFTTEELKTGVESLLDARDRIREHFAAYPAIPDLDISHSPSADDEMRLRIFRYISSNISNPGIKVEDIARAACTSPSNLLKKMKEFTGKTPSEYLLSVRLAKAAELVTEGNLTISEISIMTGFSSQSYFTQAFKKYYGCSPRQWAGKQLKKPGHITI